MYFNKANVHYIVYMQTKSVLDVHCGVFRCCNTLTDQGGKLGCFNFFFFFFIIF